MRMGIFDIPERTHALALDLLADERERSWLEFKANNSDPNLIGRSISAISNEAARAGKPFGYVIWGVDGVFHRPIGTDFDPEMRAMGNQPLPIWLTQKLDPFPDVKFAEVSVEDKRLVLCAVPAATQSPVKFEGIAMVRVGTSTTRLSEHPEIERSLWARLQAFTWERVPASEFNSATDVLKLLDTRSFFQRLDLPATDDREVILQRLSAEQLIEADAGGRWKILNLGALLIANDINEFPSVARKGIRVVEYDERDRLKTTYRMDENRGYAVSFENVVREINSRLPINEHIGEAFREERPMYPPIAIREVVANALIHQDMTITGAGPTIEIFSDRVEVTNPGAPLMPPERMIDLPPRSRNEILAALMRRMRICEEQGSGVDKVIRAIELFQLPPPDFRVRGENTNVVLFGHRSFAEMDIEERVRAAYQHAVLRYLVGQRLTNSSLRERLGIAERNAAQVTRIINDARAAELIKVADPAAPRAGYIPVWA